MKKNFTLMIAAAIIFAGCSKDESKTDEETITTPTYAASTHTWTFGSSTLTWSDAIQMPACNKADFDGGTWDAPKADGRSYTHDGKTYYYYSWPYVNQNAVQLCPNPWRVPTKADFEALADAASASELIDAWGYGGSAHSSGIDDATSFGSYWSSTATGDDIANLLDYYSGSMIIVGENSKDYGLQVRCVK
jgi:hypothetical protein